VKKRNLIADGVELGYVSWQEILHILETRKSSNPGYTRVLEDMAALLKRKSFERFHGFDAPVRDVHADGFFSYDRNLCIHFPEEPLTNWG